MTGKPCRETCMYRPILNQALLEKTIDSLRGMNFLLRPFCRYDNFGMVKYKNISRELSVHYILQGFIIVLDK